MMPRAWSDLRTRSLLRKYRSPRALERDEVGRSLRDAFGEPSARAALMRAIDLAFPEGSDPILRTILRRVDLQGQPTKRVAVELRFSERHFFRRRKEAIAALAAVIEQTVRRDDCGPVDARIWYGRGRRAWRRRTAPALREALASFEEALRIEPGFAVARVGIATVHLISGELLLADPQHMFERAREELTLASALDPDLPELHAATSDLRFFANDDTEGAREAVNEALARDPACSDARHFAVWHALARGDGSDALNELREGLRRDPDSLELATAYGVARHYERNYTEARRVFSELLAFDADYAPARYQLAATQAAAGAYAETLMTLSSAEPWPQVKALRLRARGAHAGPSTLNALESEITELPPYQRAIVYSGWGALRDASAALDRARTQHDPWVPFAERDPLLAPLHFRSKAPAA